MPTLTENRKVLSLKYVFMKVVLHCAQIEELMYIRVIIPCTSNAWCEQQVKVNEKKTQALSPI